MYTNIIRGKVWGDTNKIFSKNNVEIHRIEINKGGYCSKHRHKTKYNMFYVEDGELIVTIYRYDANKNIEDITTLEKGEITYVEPGLFHKFSANIDTIVYEIYWTELESNDIERIQVGGIKNKK